MAKGKTNNPHGRPKGSANRFTMELRTWIADLIDNNREQLEADLKELSPVERWRIVERLMSYTVPKMQSVEAVIDYSSLTEAQLDHVIAELTKSINENVEDE